MAEKIYIRRLTYSDMPAVMDIERRSFTNPWSFAMFVLELSKPLSVCLAAVTADGAIKGYLICSHHDTAWHLMNVSVGMEHRRQGIASRLINRLFEVAHVEGTEQQFTLEVRPSNFSAIQMYEAHGFKSAGVRSKYYRDDGEDALIMWRTVSIEDISIDRKERDLAV